MTNYPWLILGLSLAYGRKGPKRPNCSGHVASTGRNPPSPSHGEPPIGDPFWSSLAPPTCLLKGQAEARIGLTRFRRVLAPFRGQLLRKTRVALGETVGGPSVFSWTASDLVLLLAGTPKPLDGWPGFMGRPTDFFDPKHACPFSIWVRTWHPTGNPSLVGPKNLQTLQFQALK